MNENELSFKRLGRELKYEGNRLKFYEDTYEMPDGNVIKYDYIQNRNGAAVLPVDDDGRLVLVKQYRPPLDGVTLEIPAGSLDYPEEDFTVCAKREAEEETGIIVGELKYISTVYPLTAFVGEKTNVYIGFADGYGEKKPDFEEFINVERITLEEALDMIAKGVIVDSKTIIAVFAYKNITDNK